MEGGRADGARALLGREGLAGELPRPRPATLLLYSRARLWAVLGEGERALADLDEAARRVARHGAGAAVGLDGLLLRVRLLDGLGRVEEARAAAADALARGRRWGTPGHQGEALRAAALLERGPREVEGLRAALDALERSPAELARLHALVDLGAALRRLGERAAAREPLRAALSAAAASGARRVERRAAEELRATGERVRRPAQGVTAALTPSEARVAGMAADGMGNPEIAQALFVTRKTVEMHLGNAFRKLGIGGRSELAEALGRPRERVVPPGAARRPRPGSPTPGGRPSGRP